MEMSQFLLFLAGLLFLIAGAEMLVRGASRLAGALGMSPLVIGLTVVAFGTSAPEFSVSIQASLGGQGAISLGNVVGSNIFNILLILGVSALITPLMVDQKLIRIDVPIMIAVSILVYVLGIDNVISRWEGLALVSSILAYTLFAVLHSKKESKRVRAEYEEKFGSETSGNLSRLFGQAVLVLVGFGALVVGSRWLVDGAVALARSLNVSDLVIGLTVVAAGTSLPEVATSVVASIKGERDIAVGNVVGSNIFNILGVLGVAAAVSPEGASISSRVLSFDVPIMILVAVACLPIFFTGHVIARWEGGLFLGYYLLYVLYIIAHATRQSYLPLLSNALTLFILPLTIVTLAVLTIRSLRLGQEP